MRTVILTLGILTAILISIYYYVNNENHDSAVLVAQYQKDQKATVEGVSGAILQCIPIVSKSRIGIRLSSSTLPLVYIKMMELKEGGLDPKNISEQLQRWFISTYPEIMTEISDEDFLQMGTIIKRFGDVSVQQCITSASLKSEELRSGSQKWQLRS